MAISRIVSICSRYLVVSLPYMWRKGAEPDHIHDPIREKEIEKWFNGLYEIRRTFCDNHSRLVLVYDIQKSSLS